MTAEKKSSYLTWVGLGLMSVQFGVLARLTWWEYSWDIMEPVTYFVTYGTAMAAYAYYCLTKQVFIAQQFFSFGIIIIIYLFLLLSLISSFYSIYFHNFYFFF